LLFRQQQHRQRPPQEWSRSNKPGSDASSAKR
jgi:hypothetical protein